LLISKIGAEHYSIRKDIGSTDLEPPFSVIRARGEVLCPVVTHDGKKLFSLKGEGERTIPHWVDASFVEDLRKIELAR
jgi:hypothetical protein